MLQMINKKLRNRKGFTLIELIVVIAILGILAAIAIPRFSDVTASAAIGAAEANHRTVVSAVTMAQAQRGGSLPLLQSELDGFLQGGVSAAASDPAVTITYTATGSPATSATVVTTITKTSPKYTAGTSGNIVTTVTAGTSTTFTTTFTIN